MISALEQYLIDHSTPQSEALAWIERQTNIRTNYPRMLSGAVQGRLLTMLVEITKAHDILEIGSFTGYSATCMAYGLQTNGGGHIDALEINDELEELMHEGWRQAGVEDLITLRIGDARETLKALAGTGHTYDMVFMDANKREYRDYYESAIEMLRPGGLIIADDVLWDGKVYADPVPQDKQTQGLVSFNELAVRDPRVEVVILPLRDGISLIRKK